MSGSSGRAHSIGDDVLSALQLPLRMLIDPSERVFGGFLLTALLIGLGLSWLRGRAGSAGEGRAGEGSMWKDLGLTREIWLHRSARLDYKLWVFRAVTSGVLFPLLVFGALDVMALVVALLRMSLGPGPTLPAPQQLVVLSYTLVLFVADDLSRFVLHRSMHSNRWLWQLHQVHHSAEVLTPFSLHRVHPLESLLYAYRGSLSTGLVTGVFFYFFQGQLGVLEVMGINVLGFGFNALGANLRHSHIRWSYGEGLERWLLSPAQHQVHHSCAHERGNRNYGSFLSIWDRWANSYCSTCSVAPLQLGLLPAERNHSDKLTSALLQPLLRLVKMTYHCIVNRGGTPNDPKHRNG